MVLFDGKEINVFCLKVIFLVKLYVVSSISFRHTSVSEAHFNIFNNLWSLTLRDSVSVTGR